MKSKTKKVLYITGGIVAIVAAGTAVFSYGSNSDGVSSLFTGSVKSSLNHKIKGQPELSQNLIRNTKIQEILKQANLKAAAAEKARL